MATTLDDVYESFELLDDWSDRYRFLIELGRELPPMPEELKVPEHKVRGCLSQVWLVGTLDGDRLHFLADSDAHIVRGLVALVLLALGDKTPAEIQATDMEPILQRLGLDKHLSPGRSNGVHAMIERIKAIAAAHLA